MIFDNSIVSIIFFFNIFDFLGRISHTGAPEGLEMYCVQFVLLMSLVESNYIQ